MGKRGAQPSDNPGKAVTIYDAPSSLVEEILELVETRVKTKSRLTADAIRLGLPLFERDFPLTKTVEDKGVMLSAHVDGETHKRLDDARTSRGKSVGFVAVEAIKRGLPLVAEMYPALRKAKKRRARVQAASKASSKRSGKAKSGAAKRKALSPTS